MIVLAAFAGFTPDIWAKGKEKVERFVLASGEDKGLYYKTAIYIENISKDLLESAEIVNLPTAGSIENIERLKDGIADFAIVQRDVAVKYYYQQQNPFRQFEIVMPFFSEVLQVFIQGEPSVVEFSEFIHQIKSGKIKTFAVGAPGTASNITIKLILNLFGISHSSVLLDERPFSESFLDFKKGTISAWGLIVGYPFPPVLTDQNLNSRVALVSMNDDEIQFILSRITTLEKTEFSSAIYPFLPGNQTIKGVGTWAFLVSRVDVMDEINKFVVGGTFVQNLAGIISSEKNDNDLPLFEPYRKGGDFEFLKEEENINIKPKFKNYPYFFKGLPLSQDTASIFNNSHSTVPIYLLVTVILVGLFLLVYKNRKKIDYYKYWIRFKHIVFSSLFLGVSFFIFAKIIHVLETNFFETHSFKSGIVDLSIFDVQIWLFVFVLTGVNNNIFPLSVGGQIFATIATYIGWLAAVFSIVGEFIFAINNKKRRAGMKRIKFSGHICICGWNDSVPHLIKNSVSVLKSSFVDKKRKIVVISPEFKEHLEEDLDLKKLHDRHEVEFIAGEPRDVKSLELSNIIAAKTVVLLADDRTIDADERTLLRALAISRYVRQIENKTMDSIYIIAEIIHPKFEPSLLEADVNEIICSSYVTENLLIQSMFSHGVASLINSVIFFNEGNEFYAIDIKEHLSLAGKTFDELMVILRKAGIQLIGIKISFYDDNGQLIIDRKEIERRLNNKGLTKEHIINPIKGEEVRYKTSVCDHLLVFALDEKKIKGIEKKLSITD